MGLFKKIKDIFYDEVEVPVVKEEIKKEKEPVVQNFPPKEEQNRAFRSIEPEEKTSPFSERELFKTEKTFDFPVFEEEEEEPVRTRSKSNILELQKELEEQAINPGRREDSQRRFADTTISKPTKFRPSPVISPVYGILDKNYKKEEIVEKKEPEKPYAGEMSYDYVRRKAYGTLEDELEDTLTKVNSEIIDSVSELEKEINEMPKTTRNIEDLLNQIEQNANVSVGELEEAAKDKLMEDEEDIADLEEDEEYVPKRVERTTENQDNTLEHDLFNLIDSMYDDKEE